MRAVSQLDKNYQNFSEPERALPCLQRPVACRCYDTEELFHAILRCSSENPCILSTQPSLYLLRWFLFRGCLKIVYKVQNLNLLITEDPLASGLMFAPQEPIFTYPWSYSSLGDTDQVSHSSKTSKIRSYISISALFSYWIKIAEEWR